MLSSAETSALPWHSRAGAEPFLSSQSHVLCWFFVLPAPLVALAFPPVSVPQHIPADRATGTVSWAQKGFTAKEKGSRWQAATGKKPSWMDSEALDVRAELTALAAQQVFLQRSDSACSSALGASFNNLAASLKLVTKCVWVCVTPVTGTCQACYRTNQPVLLQQCSTAQPGVPKAAARLPEVPDTVTPSTAVF